MGRAKGNLIENLATLPWPAGVVYGVGAFFAIRILLSTGTRSDSVPLQYDASFRTNTIEDVE